MVHIEHLALENSSKAIALVQAFQIRHVK